MTRLALAIALITLVVALILKKFFLNSVNTDRLKAQISTDSLIKKVAPKEMKITTGKKINFHKGTLTIPDNLANSTLIPDHGEVLLAIGLYSLNKSKNVWLRRHNSMLTFDLIFLPFILIICIFGFLAKTFTINISCTIMACAVTLNCFNNFYITWIRYLAMNLVLDRVEKIPLYTKRENREHAMKYLSSFPYQTLLPKALSWIL